MATTKKKGARPRATSGMEKIATAAKLAASAALPGNPKALTKPAKLQAINKFEKTLSRADETLLTGVRQILESQRSHRKDGLRTWAVELSDEDFPVAVAALDKSQKERDGKLLDQIAKALKRSRAGAVRVAKKHKNKH